MCILLQLLLSRSRMGFCDWHCQRQSFWFSSLHKTAFLSLVLACCLPVDILQLLWLLALLLVLASLCTNSKGCLIEPACSGHGVCLFGLPFLAGSEKCYCFHKPKKSWKGLLTHKLFFLKHFSLRAWINLDTWLQMSSKEADRPNALTYKRPIRLLYLMVIANKHWSTNLSSVTVCSQQNPSNKYDIHIVFLGD